MAWWDFMELISISFHVLECFGHIFLYGWNCGSDDDVVFVLKEEPEDVDEGVDDVGNLGIAPELGKAPPSFVVGRSSRIQQLAGKMVPRNHLPSIILDWGSQYWVSQQLLEVHQFHRRWADQQHLCRRVEALPNRGNHRHLCQAQWTSSQVQNGTLC